MKSGDENRQPVGEDLEKQAGELIPLLFCAYSGFHPLAVFGAAVWTLARLACDLPHERAMLRRVLLKAADALAEIGDTEPAQAERILHEALNRVEEQPAPAAGEPLH